ncbi:hypothetical protein HOY82DRAFT_633094, partial [Tuber indicum]
PFFPFSSTVSLSPANSHANKVGTCPTIHGFHTSDPPSFRPPDASKIVQYGPRRCTAQRGHPPILPIIITHIHSLSGVSFHHSIPIPINTVCLLLLLLSALLTRSHWKVITYSRRRKVIVIGKYEHGKEIVIILCRCLSLESMEAIGWKQGRSSICVKGRKQ